MRAVRDRLIPKYANDPDGLRKAMAEARKTVGATPGPRAKLADVVKHINHVVQIAGVDAVGLGSDFDGIGCAPEGLDSVDKWPNLTRALLEEGYTAAEIRKIYGENTLRLMEAVEKARRSSRCATLGFVHLLRITISTAKQVPLADLAARVGTPAYVYSSRTILDNFRAYDEAFGDLPHSVCYAVKANSSLAILALLAKAGAGFDIVSGGELYRVLQAGGDPAKVVFSGVGKTADEVEYALASGIHSFNCESESELALIDAMAARRGREGGIRDPRQSRRGRLDAPVYLDRTQPAQIRHRDRRSGRGVRAGAAASGISRRMA